MKYNPETETYELESGTSFRASCGIIGISQQPLSDIDQIYSGFDSGVYTNFTHSERREIAEYMINLWKEWGR